ncbi:fungal-specific transcription factor domain-containing protein [Xylariales sp. PMI_506]|nr:fungal-specific transcription factor domain-containing protein [Xylariales sp. PMI_506]
MSSQRQPAHPAKRAKVGERTMLACTNCKQRKLKAKDILVAQCDGQSPKCSNCTKTGRDCLVEDPATGLHRPRDYVRSLETRVAYLEGLLQELRPEVANDHFGSLPTQQAEASLGSAVPAPAQLSTQQQQPPQQGLVGLGGTSTPNDDVRSTDADDTAADLLSNEVALLCLSAAGREPQYFGPSSSVHFSRIVSSTLRLPRRGEGGASSQYSNVSETRAQRAAQLIQEFPSPSRMAKLSEAYFNNIHPQYPFLHQPTFQVMEQECLAASLRNDLGAASSLSLFFVLMVYAIGSLTLGHTEIDAAEGYYAAALDHIGPLLDLDNLQSIQAMLCCAVYSVRSPVGASLWKISGMAIRHCIELGYHRSTERYRNSVDSLTKEISKRCFWVAYDIDRVASFILGRPAGISDNAIDVELPLDIDDEYITRDGLLSRPRQNPTDPPTQLTGALHAIKLRQLWSKFSDNLYSNTSQSLTNSKHQNLLSVESLRQELEEWRATSPDKLENTHSRPLSVFASNDWFQLAYYYSILLLYRHYIVDGPQSAQSPQAFEDGGDPDVRDRAFEICSNNAREMCLLYRRLYQSQRSQIQFTWGSLHILFLGGLTYLYCLWKSPYMRRRTRQTTVMNTCMACTTVLIIIAERWTEAASYRDIFEILSERTINMICGDGVDPAGMPELSALTAMMGGAPPEAVAGANAGQSSGGGMYDINGGGEGNMAQSGIPDLPLQDWIMSLDYMSAPGDSQWLAQELLQGIKDFEAETNLNALDG